jgi:hypothetical protein
MEDLSSIDPGFRTSRLSVYAFTSFDLTNLNIEARINIPLNTATIEGPPVNSFFKANVSPK